MLMPHETYFCRVHTAAENALHFFAELFDRLSLRRWLLPPA